MIVHKIGTDAIALMIDEAELRARGYSMESLSANDARELCLAALTAGGATASGMELDLFPGSRCVLLFAKLVESRPRFFEFAELEELITASHAISGEMPNMLYWYEGRYILVLHPCAGDHSAERIADFGRELTLPPQFESVLIEHARLVAGGFALTTIRDAFTP